MQEPMAMLLYVVLCSQLVRYGLCLINFLKLPKLDYGIWMLNMDMLKEWCRCKSSMKMWSRGYLFPTISPWVGVKYMNHILNWLIFSLRIFLFSGTSNIHIQYFSLCYLYIHHRSDEEANMDTTLKVEKSKRRDVLWIPFKVDYWWGCQPLLSGGEYERYTSHGVESDKL